ncbi:unnamed protein product [Ectocarpus sp. 8 AP-2014]
MIKNNDPGHSLQSAVCSFGAALSLCSRIAVAVDPRLERTRQNWPGPPFRLLFSWPSCSHVRRQADLFAGRLPSLSVNRGEFLDRASQILFRGFAEEAGVFVVFM